MKRIKYILVAMLILGSFVLVACGDNQPEPYEAREEMTIEEIPDIEPEPESETVPLHDLEPEDLHLDMDELELLSELAGFWLLSHVTDEAGKEVDMHIPDGRASTIEIRDDNTFIWHAYGQLSGDLVYLGDYSFTATNLEASSEGETWNPEDDEVMITYDPESDLLRFTRAFNDPLGYYLHPDARVLYHLYAEVSPFE